MIGLLKKANKHLMCFLVGVAVTFSMLPELLMISVTAAYTTGTSSYAVLVIFASAFSVLIFAFLFKFLIFIAFRINGAIFTRKSGMLYPFPIGFRDFESTVLAFSFPCFLLSGLVMLPTVFLPTFADVAGAIRTLTIWVFLAWNVAYFLKNHAHDYDKKSLAFSLSILPVVILGLSLVTNLLGVIR